MKIDDIKIYENKKITIFLRNKYYYSGHIIEFLDDALTFKDKFNNTLLISVEEIVTITESNSNQYGAN